jgi:hypothetical protein
MRPEPGEHVGVVGCETDRGRARPLEERLRAGIAQESGRARINAERDAMLDRQR